MSPHTTWKLLLLQRCLWPLPQWEVLKVSIWHPGSYLGSLRTQNKKGRLSPVSITPHTYHHLYYKEKYHENFFKEIEFSELNTCYDFYKEGLWLNFSLHMWLWSPFWSLLDEIVLLLTVFSGCSKTDLWVKPHSVSRISSKATIGEFNGSDMSKSSKCSHLF